MPSLPLWRRSSRLRSRQCPISRQSRRHRFAYLHPFYHHGRGLRTTIVGCHRRAETLQEGKLPPSHDAPLDITITSPQLVSSEVYGRRLHIIEVVIARLPAIQLPRRPHMGEAKYNNVYEEELLDYEEEVEKAPDSVAAKVSGEAVKSYYRKLHGSLHFPVSLQLGGVLNVVFLISFDFQIVPSSFYFTLSLQVQDVFPCLTAAHKTLLSKSRESLTTQTLHSELIYNYSGSKHISESLKRCGISDDTTYVLAARFAASQDEVH
ncbi:hypothetical protein ZIOFF_026510 [Zingiber officinale]|uniref:Uncharacterized protein n=1 Tax=Zingiber officinale TaxID=94328 RepID=A0A8J5LI06_ZINOF|nr:hypothetical protein ZIOFF_026510 [Zingiber officinale]